MARHSVGERVERQATDVDRLLGELGRAPPHDSLDPGHQFLGREGLGHVVIGPALQALDLVAFFGSGREHDDGHVTGALVVAQLFCKLHATGPGQHPVEQDQIRLLCPNQGFRLDGVCCP